MRTPSSLRIPQRGLLLRRKKQRFFLIFIFVFFILGCFNYFFFFSNFFKIRKIEVNQTRFSEEKEITKNIEDFLTKNRFLGIFPQNFFSLSKGNFSFLFKEFPSLKDFEIKKDFFQRKISFSFEEREIEGIYCQNQIKRECFYFDSSGIIFSQAPEANGLLIFLLENNRNFPQQIGNQILSIEDFLQFLKIKEILEKKEKISKANLLEKEIIFELINGTRVYFDISEFKEFNQLSTILENFLEKFTLKDFEYIDFRYLPNIYFKSFSNY